MVKIVLSNRDRLDLEASLTQAKAVESIEQLTNDKAMTFILPATDENKKATNDTSRHVFIPATQLTKDDHSLSNTRVYFDLENYPFYQRAKEMIKTDKNSKGVFRFRRMVKQNEDDSLLASDLYVLSTLLGEPDKITVKRTGKNMTPSHIIVLVSYGSGAIAHIEYTRSNRERIELEWSGFKHIVEFDSDEMAPFTPTNKTRSPLVFSVDSVLKLAHDIDQELLDRLNDYQALINGGAD